jgi:hypothetical protein
VTPRGWRMAGGLNAKTTGRYDRRGNEVTRGGRTELDLGGRPLSHSKTEHRGLFTAGTSTGSVYDQVDYRKAV